MLNLKINYAHIIRSSEANCWKVEDVVKDAAFDIDKPFFPEDGVGLDEVKSIISAPERRLLNQLLGISYLNFFNFVEVYGRSIFGAMAHEKRLGDIEPFRVLSRICDEEAKHQQAAQKLIEIYQKQTATTGLLKLTVGEALNFTDKIMPQSLLAHLFFLTLIEYGSQRQYLLVEPYKDIDPLFKKFLKMHWQEECHHAMADLIEIDKIIDGVGTEDRERAFQENLESLKVVDWYLKKEAFNVVTNLEHRLKRQFKDEDRATLLNKVLKVSRYIIVVLTTNHTDVVKAFKAIFPDGEAKLMEISRIYSARPSFSTEDYLKIHGSLKVA